jgi:pantoate--beta-alanine ligase
MVRDLDMGIDIDALSTVREPDGLALSSRNRRLDADQRRAAVCVSAALRAVHDRYEAGERRTDTLVAAGRAVVDTERLARLEHLEIVDAVTLEHLDVIDRPAVAVTAVWFGDVRLIDNVLL